VHMQQRQRRQWRVFSPKPGNLNKTSEIWF
jgi:hypothetical protein